MYGKYAQETGDKAKTVIASTASPYKFTRSVMDALDTATGRGDEAKEDFALADELSALSGVKVPRAVEEIRTAAVLHKKVCEAWQMKDAVKEFLGIYTA